MCQIWGVDMCSLGGGKVSIWGVEMCQIWGVEMCWDEVNYYLSKHGVCLDIQTSHPVFILHLFYICVPSLGLIDFM